MNCSKPGSSAAHVVTGKAGVNAKSDAKNYVMEFHCRLPIACRHGHRRDHHRRRSRHRPDGDTLLELHRRRD